MTRRRLGRPRIAPPRALRRGCAAAGYSFAASVALPVMPQERAGGLALPPGRALRGGKPRLEPSNGRRHSASDLPKFQPIDPQARSPREAAGAAGRLCSQQPAHRCCRAARAGPAAWFAGRRGPRPRSDAPCAAAASARGSRMTRRVPPPPPPPLPPPPSTAECRAGPSESYKSNRASDRGSQKRSSQIGITLRRRVRLTEPRATAVELEAIAASSPGLARAGLGPGRNGSALSNLGPTSTTWTSPGSQIDLSSSSSDMMTIFSCADSSSKS